LLLAIVLLLLMAGSTPLAPGVGMAGAQTCGKTDDYLAVWEVQGSGHTSPYDGQRVNDVRGIVTADFQKGTGGPWELRGFFLQAHETDCDAATSDGIFVYTGSSPKSVSVGDLVEIDRADVVEYQGPDSFTWELTLTELVCRNGCNVQVLQTGYDLPPVEEYDPPQNDDDALAYNEAHEGMLVQVTVDSTVVAPVNQYNEFVMLRGTDHDRLHRDDPPHGHRIMVDGDGVTAANCGQDGLGYIKTFDTITYDPANGYAVYGPLNYNFNMYKVQQDDDTFCVGHTAGDDSSYDPADNPPPAADANVFTVATLNAWNFFDTSDDPEKDDPVLTQEEFDRKSLKLADAVCNAQGLNQPLVIALQEVENDVVLQKLVGDIGSLCGVGYDYYTLAAPDDRSIEVAFLTRSDRVTVLEVNDRQGCSATDWGVDYENSDHPPDVTCDETTPYYLFNRPPLHLVAEIELAGSPRTLHIINNHFKSKRPVSVCSTSDCTDWRVEQAQHVDDLVDALLASDPDALVIVLGDLNDFYNSDPLDILDKTYGVLTNVWDDMAGPPSSGQGTITRYSYIYNGISQTLDHLLVSDALNNLARVVSPRRLNVDWPAAHIEDNTMFRSSDHDPLLVAFDFATGGDAAPNVSIVNPEDGSTVSGTVTIQVDATDAEDAAGTLTVEVAIDGGAWQTAAYNSSSGYYELDWDTTAVADGSHTIDARATDSAGNTTNATQVTVTVDNAGTGATMHVAAIDFDKQANHGRILTYDVTGLVTILDDAGNPVANAEVDVQWSGAASGSETIVTDANGVATTSTITVQDGDTVCLEVMDVRHPDYTYDSSQNVETKDCITV
jgi:predicted extracellular nuclease